MAISQGVAAENAASRERRWNTTARDDCAPVKVAVVSPTALMILVTCCMQASPSPMTSGREWTVWRLESIVGLARAMYWFAS
jgi:hypothetical protein